MTRSNAQLTRELVRYLIPHWRVVLALVGATVLEAAFDILYPLAVKLLIDNAVVQRNGELLLQLLGALAVLFVVGVVAGVGRDHLSAVVAARGLWDLRARLFAHLQRQSASFYSSHEVGDLMARFSTDMVAIENGFARVLPMFVHSSIGVLAGVPLLFVLDWRLTLVTLVVLPAAALGPKLFGGRASQATYERRQEEGRLQTIAQETIGGHQVIRAFGLRPVVQARFERLLDTLSARSRHEAFLQRLVGRSSYIGTTLAQMVIIGVGGYLVFQDVTTVGSLIGFIGLLISVGGAVTGLAAVVPELLQANAGMRRVVELLDEPPQVRDAPDAAALPRLAREIRLEDVGFSYTGEQMNLRGVSLTIKAGETVALVGRSGSGKSTIFNLLTRFYEPAAGAVLFDGHDVRRVTQDSLRAQMGVVFQDSFLFKGSILDNIRFGKPDATREEIEAAARQAQIHELVVGWPDGYDTDVGERGGRLSGGQRQRVALARALVRDPAILLLDEATSALDPATEAAFNETLRRIGAGKTVVSVTHRLSGVVDADRIFVLDQGQLIEDGPHAELLARGGAYADLWRQQQEGLSISEDGRRAAITPARLRAMPLFAGLDDEHLELIAARFSSEHLPEGRSVFEQGDPGDRFYVIAHGTVEVVQRDENGRERRLRVMQDGDVFGEVALLNDAPRSATVRTRTPCLFLTLSSHQFEYLLRSFPALEAAIRDIAQQRVGGQPAAVAATA